MGKKGKKAKVDAPITVRLEFDDQLKVDFENFRFGNRHASNKDAALRLIEDGLTIWKQTLTNTTPEAKPNDPQKQ